MYYRDQLFIDGQWSTPDSGTAIDVISPHSQEVIGRVSFAGPADVDGRSKPRGEFLPKPGWSRCR